MALVGFIATGMLLEIVPMSALVARSRKDERSIPALHRVARVGCCAFINLTTLLEKREKPCDRNILFEINMKTKELRSLILGRRQACLLLMEERQNFKKISLRRIIAVEAAFA